MKISKTKLKEIIKEELFRLMEDFDDPRTTGRWTDQGPVYDCDALKAEMEEAAEARRNNPNPMGQGVATQHYMKLAGEYDEKCGKERQNENHQDTT